MLILDDASTDNSLKIIKAYAKEDKRITVLVNQKNRGEAKCRNRLLKNSKTDFIAWMDADDISLEDRLQTQMDFLNQNPDTDAVGFSIVLLVAVAIYLRISLPIFLYQILKLKRILYLAMICSFLVL